jgi:hypothetical protein
MVRFARSPIPRPGICVTLKGGERVSWPCLRKEVFVLFVENAGNLDILAAIEGLVRMEMPRPCEKFEAVKTQKEVPLLEEQVGSIVQGRIREGGSSICGLFKRLPE